MRMQPISFELCIQCFSIFPYAQKGKSSRTSFSFFMLHNAIYMFMFHLFKELMLFVLEQVGQMMVEPAYIAGTGTGYGS